MFPYYKHQSRIREAILSGVNVLAFSGEIPFIGLAVAINLIDAAWQYHQFNKLNHSKRHIPRSDKKSVRDGAFDSALTPLFLAGSLLVSANPVISLASFIATKSLLWCTIQKDPKYFFAFGWYLTLERLADLFLVVASLAAYGACMAFALSGGGIYFTAAASTLLGLHALMAFNRGNTKEITLHLADALPRAATFACLMLFAAPGLEACVMMAFIAPLASMLSTSLVECLYSEQTDYSYYHLEI